MDARLNAGGVSHPPQPITGAITFDVRHAVDRDPSAQTAVYRGVIQSIELRVVNLTDRMRYIRGVNGGSELRIEKRMDGYEEIRATANDIFTEGGVRGIQIERIFTEVPQTVRAQRRIGLSSHNSTSTFNRTFLYWNERP